MCAAKPSLRSWDADVVDVDELLELGEQVELEFDDLHAPGFDARTVDEVVDELQQVFARVLDEPQPMAQLRVIVLPAQHPREPEDAVQRGAQLVAHGGQELGLDQALPARLLQRVGPLRRDAIGQQAQREHLGQAHLRAPGGGQQQAEEQQQPDAGEHAEAVGAQQERKRGRQDHRHDVGGGGHEAHLQAERGDRCDGAQARHDHRDELHRLVHRPRTADAPHGAVRNQQEIGAPLPGAVARTAPQAVELRLQRARHRDAELDGYPDPHRQRRHDMAHDVGREREGEHGGDQRADRHVLEHHAQLFRRHVVGELLVRRRGRFQGRIGHGCHCCPPLTAPRVCSGPPQAAIMQHAAID